MCLRLQQSVRRGWCCQLGCDSLHMQTYTGLKSSLEVMSSIRCIIADPFLALNEGIHICSIVWTPVDYQVVQCFSFFHWSLRARPKVKNFNWGMRASWLKALGFYSWFLEGVSGFFSIEFLYLMRLWLEDDTTKFTLIMVCSLRFSTLELFR